jgi:hypothetical protein
LTKLWIDDEKVGEKLTPASQDSPCLAQNLTFNHQHSIIG